jgi:hypothetical protein
MSMLLAIAVFAPLLHGTLGPYDELTLCIAPTVFVVGMLVYRVLSERSRRKPTRMRSRSAAKAVKKHKIR